MSISTSDQSNGPTLSMSASTSTLPPTAAPPEIEATLSRLSSYRNVRGVMVLSRTPILHSTDPVSGGGSSSGGGIVQSTGSVFEGDGGKKYARALESVVNNVSKAVGECDEGDELKFMRIRTKRHELIITPDERYILVVLQDPGQ